MICSCVHVAVCIRKHVRQFLAYLTCTYVCGHPQRAQQMQRVHFKRYDSISLVFKSGQVPEQPANLIAALPHIAPLKAPDTELVICHGVMSDGLADALRAVCAAGWDKTLNLHSLKWPPATVLTEPLPRLSYVDLTQPLTSEALACLSRGLTSAGKLYVPSLELPSTQTGGVGLPVETIVVEGTQALNLSAWLAQVQALGGDYSWELFDVCVCLTAEQVRCTHYLARIPCTDQLWLAA